MKKVVVYERSKILRRVGSVLLDGIIAFIIFFTLYSLIVFPCINSFSDYPEQYQIFESELLESRLYEKNANDELVIIDKEYDERLTYFYTNYDSIDNYNKLKEDSKLFEYNELTNSYVEIGSEEDLNQFYVDTLIKARDEILFKKEEVFKAGLRIEAYNLIGSAACIIPSVILVFLVIPLIFKDRATLAMKMFKLKTVSKHDGDIASRKQIVFKSLSFLIIVVFISLFTFYIPLVISSLMVLCTPYRTSLPDLICGTYVVDSAELTKEIKEANQVVIVYYDTEIEGENNE